MMSRDTSLIKLQKYLIEDQKAKITSLEKKISEFDSRIKILSDFVNELLKNLGINNHSENNYTKIQPGDELYDSDYY